MVSPSGYNVVQAGLEYFESDTDIINIIVTFPTLHLKSLDYPMHSLQTSMDTPEGMRNWLFYTSLGAMADALDVILTSVIPDKRPQRSISVSKFYPLGLKCSSSGAHVSPAVGRRPAQQ